ncbi:hypothetical protein PAV_6c00910 [Paenibacillus alvei DSM 29]|nr:hypothetical protein PAV_6c00910 [Paenibacillus alvei DSM 29]
MILQRINVKVSIQPLLKCLLYIIPYFFLCRCDDSFFGCIIGNFFDRAADINYEVELGDFAMQRHINGYFMFIYCKYRIRAGWTPDSYMYIMNLI